MNRYLMAVRSPWLRLAAVTLAGASGLLAQYLYVSNETGGVSAVNTGTGAVVATIPVMGLPTGMALAPTLNRLYVAQYSSGSLAVVDTGSDKVLKNVRVGTSPISVAVVPSGKFVYVANYSSASVSVISTSTNVVVATIPVRGQPRSLAVTPDGSRAFAVSPIPGVISVINTTSNTVIATWQVPYGSGTLAASADGSTLFVGGGSTVTLYNASSGNLESTLSGFSGVNSIAVAPAGGYAYVANGSGSSVSIMSINPLAITSTVAVGKNPSSLAVSPDGSQLYAVSLPAMSMYIINPGTRSVTDVLSLPSPYSVVSGPILPGPPPNLCTPAPTGLPPLPSSPYTPELPRSCAVPVYPSYNSTVTVSTFSGLQAALNSALCGTRISVQSGIVYTGNLVVPSIDCSSNPVLVEGTGIASIPEFTIGGSSKQWAPPVSRLLAGSATVPTLATPNSTSAMKISDGAGGWYFAGLEFTMTSSAQGVYPIVAMGETTTTVAALPKNIVFDRCLVHPSSTVSNYAARGIDLNCVNCTVMGSAIWAIVNTNQDTQAINVYNTTGPLLISNNDLEATGENFMSNTECPGPGSGNLPGVGLYPSCPPPSDITFTRNIVSKQAAWRSLPSGCGLPNAPQCYDVKNHFEIKHGSRMLVDSNQFITTFAAGQAESFIMNCMFIPTPGWTAGFVCQDVTVTSNLFLNVPQIAAIAGNGSSLTGQRVLFRNNLAPNVSGVTQGGAGLSFQIQNTVGFNSDHNTIVNQPPLYINGISFSDGPPSTDIGFEYTNSIQYGSPFANGMWPGSTIAALPSPTLAGIVFVGDWWPNLATWDPPATPAYPPGVSTLSSNAVPVSGQPPCNYDNKPISACWPLDWALVGFVDFVGGNAGTDLAGLALATSSPYHNAGTDGMDIGANVGAVLAAVGIKQ